MGEEVAAADTAEEYTTAENDYSTPADYSAPIPVPTIITKTPPPTEASETGTTNNTNTKEQQVGHQPAQQSSQEADTAVTTKRTWGSKNDRLDLIEEVAKISPWCGIVISWRRHGISSSSCVLSLLGILL